MPGKKKKGVSLIFEQVMLFLIGVVVFIISFSIFRSYETYYTNSITKEQMDDVSEMIISSLITFSKRHDTNSTIKITVPQVVGSEYYVIRLEQSGLNLTTLTRGTNIFSPLSTMNTSYSLSGGFSTLHGTEFLIYKRGNQIIIG